MTGERWTVKGVFSLLTTLAIVGPVLEEFAPELVLVSAGYDAHERDPLASMRVTTRGYAAMIRSIRDAVARHAQIALVTEGGYELTALAACIEASLLVLDGAEPGPVSARDAGLPPGAPARGERAVATTRAALKPYWRAI